MEDDSVKRETPDCGVKRGKCGDRCGDRCGDKCADRCADRECAGVQMGRRIAAEHIGDCGSGDVDVDVKAMADGFIEECRSRGLGPLTVACTIASREGFDILGDVPGDKDRAAVFLTVREVASRFARRVSEVMLEDVRDAILDMGGKAPEGVASSVPHPKADAFVMSFFGEVR